VSTRPDDPPPPSPVQCQTILTNSSGAEATLKVYIAHLEAFVALRGHICGHSGMIAITTITCENLLHGVTGTWDRAAAA